MCETKTVPVSLSLILLVAASFFICPTHTEEKLGHHGEIRSQDLYENGYKKYCLSGGECYYLVHEEILN